MRAQYHWYYSDRCIYFILPGWCYKFLVFSSIMFFYLHFFMYITMFLDKHNVIKKPLRRCYKLMQLKISDCSCIQWGDDNFVLSFEQSCFWCLFNLGADHVMSMFLLSSIFSLVDFSSATWDTLTGRVPWSPTRRALRYDFLC